MTTDVRVDLGPRTYDICIGQGFAEVLGGINRYTRALVVHDTNTGPAFEQEVGRALQLQGIDWTGVSLPAGEASKSLSEVGRLLEVAVEAGLDRRSVVVALGGGVVGDLAGFVAAVYLRGVPFLQVPTSLLAMVDSAVGGKTGVNLPQGKNLVGAFYQPVRVGVNLDTLKTLPEREYRSGLAEVIKYGIIYDRSFFEQLEGCCDGLLARDPSILRDVIARCCEIKASVVQQDERESGLRAILNYGHTFGHALEAVSGYGSLLHGEAVSVGTVFANLLSEKVCGFPSSEAGRVRQLLARVGLPVSLPSAPGWSALRAVMSTDKKAARQVPLFVLAERIGSVRVGVQVPEPELVATYETLCASHPLARE